MDLNFIDILNNFGSVGLMCIICYILVNNVVKESSENRDNFIMVTKEFNETVKSFDKTIFALTGKIDTLSDDVETVKEDVKSIKEDIHDIKIINNRG